MYELKLTPELQQWVREEFFELCQVNGELRLELTKDGEIIIMPLTDGLTGSNNADICCELALWDRQAKLGETFDLSTGFNLPNGATRSPDASWVAQDRWDALSEAEKKQFPPLCPDFVIELMSETDSLVPAQKKMEEWLENGARLGWLFFPNDEKAFIYRPGKPVEEINSYNQLLSGGDVLSDFTFDPKILK